MADPRVEKFAEILVGYSARIQPGDRVLIEATTAAEPLVRAIYYETLKAGGHPVPLVQLPDMFFPGHEDLLLMHGNDAQLDFVPPLQKLAYDQFESRIRIHSTTNTRSQTSFDTTRSQRRNQPAGAVTEAQMRRGAEGVFKWVTTLYPTEAYAQDAEMSLQQYEDFVFRAVHANEDDPIAFWKKVEADQRAAVKFMEGKDQVVLRGPNVDLTLSVKGRKFNNSCGTHNMPDGEIYTGPVEESVNGWVRFTYPAIYNGVAVEGAEITFSNGRVSKVTAAKNQDFLLKMIETDAGARYLGEFAIGTNFEIDKFTGQILFDEKIGGSFHMALGAGYPETGSKNKSAIHWDFICDMRVDSEILVDGQPFYKNGKFIFR
ncbi:MAG: aminopeptidase [Anaerolineales bacterium]|nr:MAG: aminopeptidase [Anaerolineales bacterium]